MSNSSLSNILLPAVFTASTVFSILTVPFALIKSEPLVIDNILPFFSGEIQPIFDGNHKEIAIPYIGFSIVVSVGAGMATVEVIRRWNQLRESIIEEEESSNLQSNLPGNLAQPEELKQPEYRPEVSAIDLPLDNDSFNDQFSPLPDARGEEQDVDLEADQPEIEFQPTFSHQGPALALIPEKPSLSLVPQGNNVVQFESYRVKSQGAVPDLDFARCQLLESREQYQTCRIQVSYSKQRVFAIGVNGEYYHFLRTEKTKDSVLEVLAKLGDRVQQTAITKTDKGYVIWAKESQVS